MNFVFSFSSQCNDDWISILIRLGGLIIAELMVLGFISLILTFSQYYIAKICIPTKIADTMLPCAVKHEAASGEEENRRRLLWYEHRFLAGAATTIKSSCKKEVFLLSIPCLPYSNGASWYTQGRARNICQKRHIEYINPSVSNWYSHFPFWDVPNW